MDNDYIHKQDHVVDLSGNDMILSDLVLLENIEDINFTPSEMIKFNKMISNLTPKLQHIMQIYIYMHKYTIYIP